jgi:outer membrane protein TolC
MWKMKNRWTPFLTSLILWISLAGPAFAEDLLLQPDKPLTLEQVQAIALRVHPSLQASRESVAAAKARLEQALSAYFPQINFNAAYNASTFNFITMAGQTRPSTYNWTFQDIFSMGPNLSQIIYDFGRTSSSVKQNRENAKASEEDLITNRQNVILNVKQAFFGVLLTQHLVKVAQEVVSQTKQHLEQAQGFYGAGTRPKIDVTKAEVDVANAELGLITAQNNHMVARINLNNAMGLIETLDFPIEDITNFAPMKITLDEILKAAFERRPEIFQLKAKQRSQEAAIELTQSGYYPILSGNAQYLMRGQHVPDEMTWDAFLGVSLTIPIFSGFLTANQVSEHRANLRNLRAQEGILKLNIRLEAEQAYLSLQQAGEQIRVTQKAVGQAQENFALATGRYQVGVGSPLEITDAEISLANAKVNNIQALYNYRVAEARIEKAIGVNR